MQPRNGWTKDGSIRRNKVTDARLSWRDAAYGRALSRHVLLEDCLEVEFTFGPTFWEATDPLDPGTLRVTADGYRILFDPEGPLSALAREVR